MALGDWLNKLRNRRDAAAVERAQAMSAETPEERAVSSGDIEGMAADTGAARSAHESSMEDVERLGD